MCIVCSHFTYLLYIKFKVRNKLYSAHDKKTNTDRLIFFTFFEILNYWLRIVLKLIFSKLVVRLTCHRNRTVIVYSTPNESESIFLCPRDETGHRDCLKISGKQDNIIWNRKFVQCSENNLRSARIFAGPMQRKFSNLNVGRKTFRILMPS